MALTKQTVPVVFQGGLDQKTTEELVVPGNFLRLQNCVRRQTGKIEKRDGFTPLSKQVFNGPIIDNGRKLGLFQDDLLLFTEDSLYSYSQGRNRWINRGDIATVRVSNNAFIGNNFIQSAPDVARISGLLLSVWEDSRGGIRTSILDEDTSATILFDTEVSSTGSRPRCYAANGNFIIVYYRAGGIRTRTISISTPSILGSEVAILTSGVDDAPIDLFQHDGFSAVFACNTGFAQMTIGYIYADGTVGDPIVNGYPSPKTITGSGSEAISIISDATNAILYLVYADLATIYLKTLQSSLNGIEVAYTIDTTLIETVSDVCNIAQVQYGSGGNVRIWYEIQEASYSDDHISTAVISCNGTANTVVTATADFKRSVGLVSKGFLVNADGYVVVAHDSALQPTYFVLKDDGSIVGKFNMEVGGGVTKEVDTTTKQPWLSTVLVSDNQALLIAQKRNKVVADNDNTVLSSQVNLNRVELSFESTVFNGVTLGENFNIAGGVPTAYDGVSPTELGFHIYPEDVTLAAGSSGTLNGTYRVAVTYEWVDGKGQIHRSAPSISEDITVTNTDIDVTVPTLRLTAKTGNRSNCQIVVYVTDAAGTTVYYRAAEDTNDPTSDALIISVSDVQTDAEILYTVGGVLENSAPPASTATCTHKNRMWLAGLEVKDEIAYSKERVPEEGVQFSDLFRVRVDPAGGDVTAVASMDDKLIIFKQRRIYALIGEGPVETGAQNDYSVPQLITADVGCDVPESIALTPSGLMFKSEKGLYLLDRSTGLKYIGDRVQDFNDEEITSAISFADVNEVRFTTRASEALIYNTYYDQWSTFTNYSSESGLMIGGIYYHLKSDGTVNKETPGQYRDNTTKIKMGIESSWLAVAGIQGFQRIYYLEVLGEYLSAHKTRLKLAYDYQNVYNETAYFNAGSVLGSETFGEGVFGDESPFGSSQPDRYQFRIKPRQQKCEAIKLFLEDLDDEVLGGQSVSMIAVTLTVGIKTGANRLGNSQTIGAQ